MSASVTIKGDRELLALIQEAKGDGWRRRVGTEVREYLKGHFRKLDEEKPHKPYWNGPGRRTHHYGAAARQTSYALEANTIVVTTDREGIASRQRDTDIAPKKKRWLTIPAIAQAHGKVAADFGNLRFVKFSDTLAALVEKTVSGATKGQSGKSVIGKRARLALVKASGYRNLVYFWLKKSVMVPKDETIVPTMQDVEAVATQAARNYFAAKGLA
jgi:hypothetical protein